MFDTFKIILESGFKHFKQAFPKSLCEIRFILHLENAWTSFSVVHGSSHDYIITFFILSQRSGINFNYVAKFDICSLIWSMYIPRNPRIGGHISHILLYLILSLTGLSLVILTQAQFCQ